MPHAEEVGGGGSATPRLAARAGRAAATVALAVVALSLCVRASVRDRVAVFDVVFYATPLVLDAVAASAAALVLWRCGAPRRAAVGAALAVTGAALCAGGSFVRNEPGAPGAIRGVFWNVEGGAAGWRHVATTLAALRPDVAWLAEAGDRWSDGDAEFAAALPEHTLLRAGRTLVVLVRGGAETLSDVDFPGGRAAVQRIETRSRAFRAVFADVGSHALPRSAPLGSVRALAVENLAGPLLVVGDFNTPRDSAAFDDWRGPLAHGFETTGRGYDATWPMPVPVLAIDHVWSGGGLAIRTCEFPWTRGSDHLPVVFTFDVP